MYTEIHKILMKEMEHNKWKDILCQWNSLDSSVDKESACNAGDPSLIPGSGRSTGERIGYPLQYSWASLVAELVKNCLQCGRPRFDPWVGKIPWKRERLQYSGLENSMDCIVHGVAKSRTRLSDFHFMCHRQILWGN